MPLELGPRITMVPVIHGSGDFSMEVRRMMLERSFDCLAVPLPPSYQAPVEAAIPWLPMPTVVVQRQLGFANQGWKADSSWADDDLDDDDDIDWQVTDEVVSYVPIDPCQPVIAAIRVAMGERIPRMFIDLETDQFVPYSQVMPDPYALKKVSVAQFAAAVLPTIPPPSEPQRLARIGHMALQLRELEQRYQSILCVCSLLDWPWLRAAFQNPPREMLAHEEAEKPAVYEVESDNLMFLLGELPFITALYERARQELGDEGNLAVDGVKELLIAARTSYYSEFKNRARKITTHGLSTCLKYIRNLTLLERRLTPDLYTIVTAAKQVLGDGYALHVAERARDYLFLRDTDWDLVAMGIDRMRMPDGDIVQSVNRLPGPPLQWRSCELKPRPDRQHKEEWEMRWNPFAQCSWPPEDKRIEDFRAHVTDRARAIMGVDLAKTEKFTTSIKDGIDIRDTLRNWHTGDLYVKVLPPNKGKLDAVVMLFDSPADPREYGWRTTWFAEHQNESTLAFFATNFHQELVGPGIGLATYGGALFLFPPVSIPDIWKDPNLDFTETLEERLLAAACLHSECANIALVSYLPPGPGWRRLAQRFRKKWVHVPLGSFGDATIKQLRMVHVLNGRHVRSYAERFIRKA